LYRPDQLSSSGAPQTLIEAGRYTR